MKKIIIITGCIVAVIITVAITSAFLFNINSYKPKIETACSNAIGLDLKINGRMGLSFFPFGISAHDIHIAGNKGDILSLESIKIGVEIIPLLKKQIKISSCELIKPIVTIVKYANGKYNFEGDDKKHEESATGGAFSLYNLKLSKGAFVYIDKKRNEKTELKEIDLAIKDLGIADTPGQIIKKISFSGSIGCKEINKKALKINNLSGFIQADKGVFLLKPLNMDIFGATGKGDVIVEKSEADTVYKINWRIANLDFENLQDSFGIKKMIGGKGDLAVSLSMKEKKGRNIINSMNGTLSLKGNNLITYTADLDKVLSSYEESQEFSLVDIGAFLITGPLGPVALKGYSYGNIYYQSKKARGSITKLVSDWKINNGVADATDCALSTRHNRVAIKGRLNLVKKRYENFTVALLDAKGCAKFKQGISGSFGSPQVGMVFAVQSLAEPLLNLYKQAKRFVQGSRCEAFYNGSVKHP